MTLKNGNLAGQRRNGAVRWQTTQKAKAATCWLIDVWQAVLLAWVLAAIFNLVEEKEKEDGEADD